MPFMRTILADSTGPIVKVNKTELDYGSVDVLKDYTQTLVITNNSSIPAEYTAFTKNKVSIWKVIQRHGELKPDESKEIEVVCNADECQKFADSLHIIINHGVDLEIALRARGVGSTLYCKDNLNQIDFGTEYTHSKVFKEFFLENRGRKPQKIVWSRVTKPGDRSKGKQKEENEEEKSQSGKKDLSVITEKEKQRDEEDLKQTFSVCPDKITLNPKMGVFIQFRCESSITGRVSEMFQCNSTVGGERKPRLVYTSTVQGDFIGPQLNYSDPKLYFKYMWEKNVPAMPITKTLDITNSGDLPTSITLKIQPPFSCNTEVLTLPPGNMESISIDFDPGMRQDRISGESVSKLSIIHKGHPQKDHVELIGEVCYPNLSINPSNIEFGCILNDTSKKKYITMTNASEMVCAYDWSFLEEEITSLLEREDEEEEKKKKKKKKEVPINEVFDILPVSGILHPGETETVEFTYYAGHGQAYNGIAVCSVDGGPDYQIPLKGDSSTITFKLSADEIDFGEIPYSDSASREFYVENAGKVPFEFNVNLSTVSRAGLIEAYPMSGKVMKGEKFRVVIKFNPGIPATIDEMFLVECAHFPAERFKIKAVGTYPGCLLTFPRKDEGFAEKLDQTRALLGKGDLHYDAAFAGRDIKLVQSAKSKHREEKFTMDPDQMELEAETDRLHLCESILGQYYDEMAAKAQKLASTQHQAGDSSPDKGAAAKAKAKKGSMAKTGGFSEMNKTGAGFHIENMIVTTYQCDFGDMVVGAAKKRQFRLTNVGKIPISFNFDKKLLTSFGLTIEPD